MLGCYYHLLVVRKYGDGELAQVGGEDFGERRFVPPRGDLQHRRDDQVGWSRQGPNLTRQVFRLTFKSKWVE